MKLVFIEGPGKQESIKKYLGDEFTVFATKGHIRDLPAKTFGIDVNNNFQPEYVVIPEKKSTVEQIKKLASKAEAIYLASDPDREGEAIAWHIAKVLDLDPKAQVRTAFNEISKKAVNESIANPQPINLDLVNAQQGRRVLDRLVGYKLSPLLMKKIHGKLSAGRVQSVTLKLIVDREKAIQNFVPVESWDITAELNKNGSKFKADLVQFNDKKLEIPNKEAVDKILPQIENAEYKVSSVKRQITYSKPLAPYITSTLQQDAGTKLKMSLSACTKCMQTLYEGVMIQGEGKTALVTYIRTDSTRVSQDAQFMARDYILEKYGKEYHPGKFNTFSSNSKENVQDAHEAIRPINLKYTPEYLKGKVEEQYLKLYTLIFKRFVASQMSYAQYDSLTVEILANNYKFKSSGKAMIFDGYTKVYKAQEDDKNSINIPDLIEGEIVQKEKLTTEQKFSKPPVRFTEVSIVHEMEVQGIGRPSTYASTIATLFSRDYVKTEKKALIPTELGVQVTEYLEEYFKDIMDIKFTAEMEKQLDDVELGKTKWQDIVGKFYPTFLDHLSFAGTQMGVYVPKSTPEPSDVKCDKCGAMMVFRESKFGKFLACSNFPQCKNTKSIENQQVSETGVCPKCGGVVSAKHSKKGKLFFGCDNYPKCDYLSWDLPLSEKCPLCGAGLFKKINAKGKETIICNNKGCSYVKD